MVIKVIIIIIIAAEIRAYPQKLRDVSKKVHVMHDIQKEHEVKILYLRGFGVDGLRHKKMSVLGETFEYVDTNFETQLALTLGQIGHFIAIGLPSYEGDIGAERFAVEAEQWQDEVLGLMQRSAIIIFRPSYSIGVMWEVEQIVKLGYLHKTIICFDKAEDDGLNYALFREQVAAMIRLPKSPSTFMTVGEDGRVKQYPNVTKIELYATLLKQGGARQKQIEAVIGEISPPEDDDYIHKAGKEEMNLVIAGGIFFLVLALGIAWYLMH